MSNVDEQKLKELHDRAAKNDTEILNSDVCSCFFCRQTYSARDVQDWITEDDGVTAICPICGMDAVIGDRHEGRIDHDTLKQLNLRYYGENYMEHHPEAAWLYCQRFLSGKITKNKQNASLFVKYLTIAANSGMPEANYELGHLYEFGNEETSPDPQLAMSYYCHRSLAASGDAYARVGCILQSGALRKPDATRAYECFAKGMALGSGMAALYFADCYANGTEFIAKNPDFAFQSLIRIWGPSYDRFTNSAGQEPNVFGELCARLSRCYEYAIGVEADEWSALRYALLAFLGFRKSAENGELREESTLSMSEVMERITRIAKKRDLKPGSPVFDADTFDDSLLNPDGYLPSDMTAVMHFNHFDTDDRTIDFTTSPSIPQLVIDTGNLFCDFVPGTIRWTFTDILSVSTVEEGEFTRVTWEGDNCVFADDDGAPILEITFFPETDDNDKNWRDA